MTLNKNGAPSAPDDANGLGCQLDAFYTILEKKSSMKMRLLFI